MVLYLSRNLGITNKLPRRHTQPRGNNLHNIYYCIQVSIWLGSKRNWLKKVLGTTQRTTLIAWIIGCFFFSLLAFVSFLVSDRLSNQATTRPQGFVTKRQAAVVHFVFWPPSQLASHCTNPWSAERGTTVRTTTIVQGWDDVPPTWCWRFQTGFDLWWDMLCASCCAMIYICFLF